MVSETNQKITSFEFYLHVRNALYSEDDLVSEEDLMKFSELYNKTAIALKRMESLMGNNALANPKPLMLEVEDAEYIYYGDETAMCGWTDPDSRRPFPWNNMDHEMVEFYKYMGGIHRVNPALRKGSFKFLRYDYGLLMYGRFVEDNRMAVVINNNDRSIDVDIPVWQLGIENGAEMRRIMSTSAKGYNVGPIYYMVKGGKIRVHVHAYGSILVRTIRDGEWVDPVSLDL